MACFRCRVKIAINKKQKYFSLPHQQLPKTFSIDFGFSKGKKGIKANF